MQNSNSFIPANEKQKRFMESTAKELLLSGAVGAGKSYVGCSKGAFINYMFPGSRGLIVRKNYSSLKATTIRTLMTQVIPASHVVEYNTSEHRIIHRTKDPGVNSEIWYFGLDKGAHQDYPTKILSTEWTWIFYDETIEGTEKDWEVLLTRLRFNNPHLPRSVNDTMPRQIWGATNPDGPQHWLKKRFMDEKTFEDGTPITLMDREVVLTTPYDNPFLPAEYIRDLEKNLKGLAKQRLLYGKWVQAEGIIYEGFDREHHVITDKDLLPWNEYKDYVAGADSNFPLPRAAVFIGIRGDGRRDIIDEFYRESAHPEDVRNWLLKWYGVVKKNIRVYHDPSDPEAMTKIRAPGIIVMKAINDVNPGIDSVTWYIEEGLLRVHSRCTNWMTECEGYVWKKDSSKLERAPDKTRPDHLMDATRYALHSSRVRHYKPLWA